MLRIKQIIFTDKNNKTYTINQNQIESFPLKGGTTSNTIKTKAWNQHGNTFIDAFLDSIEDELIFAIFTTNKADTEIADMRKEIANMCNPLNGVVEMAITLNTGEIYRRDITFVSSPIFPIGFENRNKDWQKVQLLYEANNPFWYSDETITETFQTAIPLFEFPFEMSETAPIQFGENIPSKFVVNKGQVEAPVEIRIVGACINPIIENITTGEMIRFKSLTMGANDELLIDTTFGQKKVLLNGVANVFNTLDFMNTSFFNLQIGENEIDFRDDTALTPEATIYFVYKNLYHTI